MPATEGAVPRHCGSCSMCCKIIGVEALQKPANVWCAHCAPGRGCKIYAERPAECRTFACRWLVDLSMPDDWRPDQAKFVIFPDDAPERILVHLDPAVPDAWRKEPYQAKFRRLAGERLRAGGCVLLALRGRCTILFPQGEADLGVVSDDDKIMVREIAGPSGTRWEAEVVRSGS